MGPGEKQKVDRTEKIGEIESKPQTRKRVRTFVRRKRRKEPQEQFRGIWKSS